MPRTIAVTWDYRCPFARNAHEAVVTALRQGADLDVRFLPFSLDQAHVEEGEPPVWDRAPDERGTGVLSLQWGIAVRDSFPERFLDFHVAAFAARFDDGRKIGKLEVVRDVAAAVDLDVDAVAEEVATGRPLKTLAAEHTEAVDNWAVFGVPTFIEGDEAVFIRFMERNRTDDLERALDLIEWARLNEFKRTRIPR
ncbi:MAG: DsbA family oxidoreductase [Acidimicrobiia bacterium]